MAELDEKCQQKQHSLTDIRSTVIPVWQDMIQAFVCVVHDDMQASFALLMLV